MTVIGQGKNKLMSERLPRAQSLLCRKGKA